MTWGDVKAGDWVKATESFTIGLSGGSTIKAGTEGVVNNVIPSWFSPRATVTFDGGFGTVDVTVPVSKLRVVRRGAGVERFKACKRRVAAARAALALFIVWPVISFAAQYVWQNHGFSGITAAFALGVVESFASYLEMLLTKPVRAAVYLGFLGLVGRLAWR